MADLLLHMGMVNFSLIILLALPALPLSVFLTGKKASWPEVLLVSGLLGCCCQAVIGLVWSHLVGRNSVWEAFVYFGLWGLISLVLYINRRSSLLSWQVIFSKRSYLSLIFLLASAFVVRSIHPLQTAALGQSDAYTHLQYLHEIVDQGRLFNVVYPSGYHWILALPVCVFGLDPYWVVRFCGAFFGTALVLAIYVFLSRLFDRRSALFGSFCAACFPGMILLMKTGVGAFANQLGLFLVPCILYLYNQLVQRVERQVGWRVLFSVVCLGLAASVPMMLLHVFILFVIERFATLLRRRGSWLRQTALLLLLCLPAVFLIVFHFSQAGSGQRFKTAEVLMEYGGEEKATTEKIVTRMRRATGGNLAKNLRKNGVQDNAAQVEFVEIIVTSPYFHLLVDFFTIKRFGFSNLYIDLMGWSLLVLYLLCLGFALYQGGVSLMLLGIWGVLTTVQASTGFLQLSSYQREGWSLLIATCCLSGVLSGKFYALTGKYQVVRFSVVALMIALFCWTLGHPPGHPVIQSSAEDVLVQAVRFLSKGQAEVHEACAEGNTASICKGGRLLSKELPLTIVTRRFTGWHNQGEIVPNVMPPDTSVTSLSVNAQGVRKSFTPDRQYVVLLDRMKSVRPSEITSAFAMVAPSQIKAVLRQQDHLYKANETIRTYISNLPKSEWWVYQEVLSANLTAYVVIPQHSKFNGQ
ncbi:MAG: hypothetical protein D3924_00030 [Candidatus Electrothrix sp. AR4]|nr:hypothetical protein [Candidatus Electrothrix sp. AR4]